MLPIQYPLPNKELLLAKIANANVFSKFDLKSGFWQIGILPDDRYKTAFIVPHGQYQWTIMPFGLKNAPSEFQKRMEDIFGGEEYIIVYINDLLVFSRDVNSHKLHLEKFYELVYKHGLVLSDLEEKFQIGKVRIDYLGLHIEQGHVNLQPHVLTHLLKFPNVIPDIRTLQRFLGCLNYIRQFYEKQADDTKVLQKRLKKQATGWIEEMTNAVRSIKRKITDLPKLKLRDTNLPFILETDALDHTWAAVLLQKHGRKELVCAYSSGTFDELKESILLPIRRY